MGKTCSWWFCYRTGNFGIGRAHRASAAGIGLKIYREDAQLFLLPFYHFEHTCCTLSTPSKRLGTHARPHATASCHGTASLAPRILDLEGNSRSHSHVHPHLHQTMGIPQPSPCRSQRSQSLSKPCIDNASQRNSRLTSLALLSQAILVVVSGRPGGNLGNCLQASVLWGGAGLASGVVAYVILAVLCEFTRLSGWHARR